MPALRHPDHDAIWETICDKMPTGVWYLPSQIAHACKQPTHAIKQVLDEVLNEDQEIFDLPVIRKDGMYQLTSGKKH